jgi:excisionase family DNA binding protein
MKASTQEWSGPCPDLNDKQRSRDVESSAAEALTRPEPPAEKGPARPALDATGSAPLPTPSGTSSAMTGQLLTARTVAEILCVCAETVLRWIRNGQLPAIRLPGGAIRVPESDLHDWLRARATPGRGVLATTADAADSERYLRGYDWRR